MSYDTWKKEFYKVYAGNRMSVRKAILHSIQKWTGLLPGALKRHGLLLDGRVLETVDGRYGMSINGSSCALCRQFVDKEGTCENCPLYQFLGYRCDDMGPYNDFMSIGDPKPMIRALKATLRHYDKLHPQRKRRSAGSA